MAHHLIAKLEHFTRLSTANREALHELAQKARWIGEDEDIALEGNRPKHVNLILDGWACRYKQLEDGRRQILRFFLPGDLCDAHSFVLPEMDHSIATLTHVRVAEVRQDRLLALMDQHPRIAQALWWELLVDGAIQREWTVSLGQRTSLERLSHLLCELFIRLRCVGLTEGDACLLPTTQAELASATGMSTVHVNRTLQEMRSSGLITLKGKRLTIPDLSALQKVALFNQNYLHLRREGAHLDANE